MKGQNEIDIQKLNICMLLPLRYGPNMRVNPQVGIASYLTNFGHKVIWIISSANSRRTQQFSLNGVSVHASPYIPFLSETSLLGKVFNLIPATFKKVCLTLKVFTKAKYDLIFVRDDTLDGLLATYIKRRYKIPFVYELSNPLEQVSDIYKHKIETAQPRPLYYLIARFNTIISIYIAKKADLILPTTRWFEEGLIKKRISASKLMPYPNGVDIESFLNKDGKGVREKYHLGNSKVIIYVGGINKSRYLSMLIEAFSEVKQEGWNVKLLMVGDGTDRQNLEKLTTELEVRDDVIFAGQVPQSMVPHFIAAADIGVSLVPPLSFFKVSSPIKMLEYMAMAKPVVANQEIYEHKEVIEQSGGGILVPFVSEAFASAITELLDNPERAENMGRKGCDWIIKNRSYEILARRLELKYFELLKSHD